MLSGAALWALASMAGQGFNDLFFKRFTARSGSLGVYFAGVGAVWAAALLALEGDHAIAWDPVTVIFGLAAGTFSVTANIALVRALARLDAAIGVTIFRLNFVLVMWLAVPALGEPLTPPKLGGLAAAALAVLLFARDGHKAQHRAPAPALALAVAVVASMR